MENEKNISVYFIFNKITQEMIGMSFDSQMINGDILWRREMISIKDDPTDITWIGDYNTGHMAFKTDSGAEVNEIDLEKKLYERLFRKYPFEEIIRILLRYLGNNLTGDEDEETVNMVRFAKKNEEKLVAEATYFKNSPKHKYLSKKELMENISRQFAT